LLQHLLVQNGVSAQRQLALESRLAAIAAAGAVVATVETPSLVQGSDVGSAAGGLSTTDTGVAARASSAYGLLAAADTVGSGPGAAASAGLVPLMTVAPSTAIPAGAASASLPLPPPPLAPAGEAGASSTMQQHVGRVAAIYAGAFICPPRASLPRVSAASISAFAASPERIYSYSFSSGIYGP